MNPIKQKLVNITNSLKDKLRSRFAKTLGIKSIGEYKYELHKLLDDIQLLSDPETIDELIAEYGIAGTAQQYKSLNNYYRDYYKLIIKEVNSAYNSSSELKSLAKRAEIEWEKCIKSVIAYLYKKKQLAMYGESFEVDHFSGVRTFHANSFADKELPWLRKEDLNEVDHFDEGFFGATFGASTGAVLAMVVGSLSVVFHLHPKVFTGIAAGLGAIIGHFIQKHYFIDFTNYVKLKRYIEYEPEAYEMIIEMLQKNATKFQQKDPIKYKKIINNLQRLQKNAPPEYRSFLDDAVEQEAAADDDPNLFDVYDKQGNLVKRGTSELSSGGNDFRSSRKVMKSGKRLGRQKDYDVRDLGDLDNVEGTLTDLSRSI